MLIFQCTWSKSGLCEVDNVVISLEVLPWRRREAWIGGLFEAPHLPRVGNLLQVSPFCRREASVCGLFEAPPYVPRVGLS